MKSILQNKKECYICSISLNLENHHIFFGRANRGISEKDGLKVWLCYAHHRGTYGVHGKYGHAIDILLKKEAERIWLEHYGKTTEEFIQRYGKNYL